MSHRCQRCGASCQGVRVRVEGEERTRIGARASDLGIERPFSGPYLRQNWGRCVFYADGCRLHATFGADAKPTACRQFPVLNGDSDASGAAYRALGVDPACFHPGEPAPEQPDAEGRPADERWHAWQDLGIGTKLAERLRALPFHTVCRPQVLGPITAEALEGLERSEPVVPGSEARFLRWAARAALPTVDHHAEAEHLLIGGGQLLCGLGRGRRYAAWVRLLRQVQRL